MFYVEQGTPFHLKFVSDTYPPPSADNVELYKNDRHLPRVQGGTIFLDGDSMDIQRVDERYNGAYKIKSSSGGELSFRLKVKGNRYTCTHTLRVLIECYVIMTVHHLIHSFTYIAAPAYSQPPDPDKGYPW